jgi:hypothetical protein
MFERMPRRRSVLSRAGSAGFAIALSLGLLAMVPATAHAATPTAKLTMHVESARTEPRAFSGTGVTQGDPIAHYKFLLNIDDTGTTASQRSPVPGSGCASTDPGYPQSCLWPSIQEPSGWAPIYAQGNEQDLANLGDLPDGRYLISVLADGYKIDGAHFCIHTGAAPVPGCTTPLSGDLTVTLQPTPLPDGTLRAFVFEDNAPTNMGYDTGEATMAGFEGHIVDSLGLVTTDVYGNPLCTRYQGENPDTYVIPDVPANFDADGNPIPIAGTGGKCVSDASGMLAIPHLGSNRYAVSVTPPDGQTWIQTTTLEGNHDYDSWLMEGDTGYSQIFTVGGEPAPDPIFGYVRPTNTMAAGGTNEIKGSVVGIKTYTPPKGGSFDFWGGNTGTKVNGPIVKPWLSLSDLNGGDVAVYVGQGNADGSFDITGVPDGDYTLSWWDEPQDYNLNTNNVTVRNGEILHMGQLPLNGWWTEYSGYVFDDQNRNGVRDPGEKGIPNFTLTLRHRENNLYDRGTPTATTDSTGHYYFESGYPIGEWVILEAYNDSYYTTGVTYQADNQPTPTTVKGQGVDISTLPIIGLTGTVDWGVHAYDPTGSTNGLDPRNGGIVGTLSYDTTRNELDPQYAAAEDWQPGISGVPVELYAPVDCGTNAGAPCDANGRYELDPADGSYVKGKLLNTYVSESWQRPTGCTARDVDGNPLVHFADRGAHNGQYDENVLVPNQETNGECISSFMQGTQYAPYATDQGTPDANFGAAVNGNYGFGDGCFNGTLDATDPANPVCTGGKFTPLGAGDYLVHPVIPDDATGHPEYKVTSETDINIANGEQIVPQAAPPACAGALHTVDLAGQGTDGYQATTVSELDFNGNPVDVNVAASTPVDNQPFVGMGGTPYEGQQRPSCDTKLVRVNNGKSVVPIFNLFTDVPVPSRLRSVIIDDLRFTNDPRSIMYGEKAGLAFAPVGIYDFANKLEYTTETDFNGIYDVLMPSTNHISCPTPSGVCANMYRFVANDPGIPGQLNPNYNPAFATMNAGAEAMPGDSAFADLAPTQVGLTVEIPQTGLNAQVTCPIDGATPQLLRVSQPYVNGSGSFSITGTGFGATKGTGKVTLDGTTLPTTSWTDTQIDVTVPAGTPTGTHQLDVTADNGQSLPAGLTFHVLGAGYNPHLYEVGPGKTYAKIQDAVDAAYASAGDDLVVVYPGNPDPTNPRINPRGAYYENLIIAAPVKLQGVGPGGFQGNTYVPGSIIDASSYSGDLQNATDWFNKVGSLTWDGNQTVNDGEAIYLLASQNQTTAANTARAYTNGFQASIDGFDIRGGNQNGFPGNINDLTGGATGLPPNISTQGGAIFANAYVRHLQITNNVVQNNAGAYGTIRIGTPDLAAPDTNQHNEDVRIAHNRIIMNGGTNLAGGVGLFAGSDNYSVDHNDICGNFSLEYGGGMSVYGYSPNGQIHHNRIYFNMSNDEGGGVMMAGQLPLTAGELSPGTGPVDIHDNQIQGNLANDDGGGIRFLMAGNYPMNVDNNFIVNNVSTHEGGGIALDDAPNVRVFNNTIMKNITTATAVTSDGQPAPAGLSTAANSNMLQATLPAGSPGFSNPLLFNNIFWDNRAGTRAGQTVTGIGLASDSSPINQWDLGVPDGSGQLAPTNSVLQDTSHPYTASPTNKFSDPAVASTYDVSVSFATWRQNPAFVDATLTTVEAPPNLLGDYRLTAGSPAINLGAASKAVPSYQAPPAALPAPALDFDGGQRPALGGFDAGADEFGAVPPPPPAATADLYFSTVGNANPPGVTGTADDADVYKWNSTAFSREWDATVAGVPSSANLDGFSRVDATHFYASFTDNVTLPGLGTVADEDVVYFNAGTWSLFFDGSANGLATGVGTDLDAISMVGNSLYFSTDNSFVPPGSGPVGSGDDSDIYRWNGGSSFTKVWDASANGYPTAANVDGLIVVDPTHFYLSFSNDTTTVPGVGAVQDEDVVYDNAGTWSVFFDGTAQGLGASPSLDLDAISFAGGATPPPPPPPELSNLSFSTAGNTNPPGLPATPAADAADIYGWNGTAFNRAIDVSALPAPVPSGANVDGFDRASATLFYLSFSNTSVTLPGIGAVQDEDIVSYDTTTNTWSVYFDGTAHGLTAGGQDIDEFSIVGGTLYFSTVGNVNPTGVTGTADNADIYTWDGTSFARFWDATAAGVPPSANVDGLDVTDGTHFYLSFAADTVVPSLGIEQDEDVISFAAGTWAVAFDGTAHGLGTSPNLNIDAIDVP